MTDPLARIARKYGDAEELTASTRRYLEWRQARAASSAPTEKTCSACDQTKPLADFGRDKSRADGRAHRCRECERARDRARVGRP